MRRRERRRAPPRASGCEGRGRGRETSRRRPGSKRWPASSARSSARRELGDAPAAVGGALEQRRRGTARARRRACRCTSVSRIAAPCASARSKEASVFSGASPRAPRWPITIGRGTSKYGMPHARTVSCAAHGRASTRDVILRELERGRLRDRAVRARPGRPGVDRPHARRRDPRDRARRRRRSRSATRWTTAITRVERRSTSPTCCRRAARSTASRASGSRCRRTCAASSRGAAASRGSG